MDIKLNWCKAVTIIPLNHFKGIADLESVF